MTPETLVQHATALFQALAVPGGALAGIVGVCVYGYGKAADSPNATRWAKQAWIGAAVLTGGSAVVALVQNVGQRLFGG